MRVRNYEKQIYAWEGGMSSLTGRNMLSDAETEDYIIKSHILFECKPPKIRHLSSGTISSYFWRPHRISMVDHHKNPMLVLHETSHSIAVKRVMAFAHGPTFCGVYQYLLMHFKVFSRKFVKSSMEAYRIPWDPISPGNISMVRNQWQHL